MQSFIPQPEALSSCLRAVIEVIDGKVVIYPIADSDIEAKHILDALRLACAGK